MSSVSGHGDSPGGAPARVSDASSGRAGRVGPLSCGGRDEQDAGEGADELSRPGPAGRETEVTWPAAADQAGGDAQQAEPEQFRFGFGEVVVESVSVESLHRRVGTATP